MSQKIQVLNHIKKRSLTAAQAIEMYGIYRLAARIEQLRTHHNITTTMKKGVSRNGSPVRYAVYRYKSEKIYPKF